MSEERLKEIKDSIDLQHDLLTIKGDRLELINEEIELYNEVVRLQKENEMLKLENKNNYETNQDIIYEMQDKNDKLKKILIEFEKWLEGEIVREINHPTQKIYCNCCSCKNKYLEKLQELKGVNNEYR